jgi:hypothetical protein
VVKTFQVLVPLAGAATVYVQADDFAAAVLAAVDFANRFLDGQHLTHETIDGSMEVDAIGAYDAMRS